MRNMRSLQKGVVAAAAALVMLACLCSTGGRVEAQNGMPPNLISCETRVWNAFWEADSTYTTTLHSWYFENPTSCYQECEQTCQQSYGSDWQQCMSTCQNNCQTQRYDAFTSAQDGLASAAWGIGSCPATLDFCDAARAKRDECNNTFYWSNQSEMPWYTAEEFQACMMASGIHRCE